jgi:peptidoglycan hydrolase-like amidase
MAGKAGHGTLAFLGALAVAVALLSAGGLEAASAQEEEQASLPPVPPLTIRGGGWGHSVGMSQYGARAMAIAGRDYGTILRHYYPGVSVGQAGSAPGDTEIRVNLFAGRTGLDATRVQLRRVGRATGTPTTDVIVDLGGGTRVSLPHTDTSSITFTGGRYVLRRSDGAERASGPGPARIIPQAPAGSNPALLALPQLGSSADRLAGTFQWGYLHLTHAGGGALHPVMVLPIELYLRGIAEMPSSWEAEALRAQAATARTYATRQLRGGLRADCACHLGATPAWQVYAGWQKEGGPGGSRWRSAVDTTRQVVVRYGGDLAWTFYSSSHGGRTENSEDSWAFSTPFPYLRSVDDPWSLDPRAGNPYASWAEQRGNDAFAAQIPGVARVASVGIGSRTAGGSPLVMTVRGWDADGRNVTRSFRGDKGAGAALRNPLSLRSQQIRSVGLPPFRDDDGNLHEYNIWQIARRGITTGCAADRYCPNDPVTRGQMASFVARALGLDTRSRPDRFADIATSPHRAAINAIADEGITTGCTATRYCPNDPVTREQMATFIQRAFNVAASNRDPGFNDIAGSVHRRAIWAIANAGITGGCRSDAYCPRNAVSRAQMASFIARARGEGW